MLRIALPFHTMKLFDDLTNVLNVPHFRDWYKIPMAIIKSRKFLMRDAVPTQSVESLDN